MVTIRVSTSKTRAKVKNHAATLDSRTGARTPGRTGPPSDPRRWRPRLARKGRIRFAPAHIDWSERYRHFAGPPAKAATSRLLELGWVARTPSSRAVRVTGQTGLREYFDLDLDEGSGPEAQLVGPSGSAGSEGGPRRSCEVLLYQGPETASKPEFALVRDSTGVAVKELGPDPGDLARAANLGLPGGA